MPTEEALEARISMNIQVFSHWTHIRTFFTFNSAYFYNFRPILPLESWTASMDAWSRPWTMDVFDYSHRIWTTAHLSIVVAIAQALSHKKLLTNGQWSVIQLAGSVQVWRMLLKGSCNTWTEGRILRQTLPLETSAPGIGWCMVPGIWLLRMLVLWTTILLVNPESMGEVLRHIEESVDWSAFLFEVSIPRLSGKSTFTCDMSIWTDSMSWWVDCKDVGSPMMMPLTMKQLYFYKHI